MIFLYDLTYERSAKVRLALRAAGWAVSVLTRFVSKVRYPFFVHTLIDIDNGIMKKLLN